MSIENISVSIDPSPLVSIVKTVIREELQPTLYGNDNTLAAVINEEVAVSPRIHDRIVSIISDYTTKSEFDCTVKDIIHTEAERIVRDNLDYSDLAAEIDASDVAAYIKMSRLAAEINACDIANEISCSDIANELSVSDIADEIDIENLADTIAKQHMIDIAAEVSEKINYKKLAAELLDVIAERSQPKPTV
jgi:hypothetical protein